MFKNSKITFFKKTQYFYIVFPLQLSISQIIPNGSGGCFFMKKWGWWSQINNLRFRIIISYQKMKKKWFFTVILWFFFIFYYLLFGLPPFKVIQISWRGYHCIVLELDFTTKDNYGTTIITKISSQQHLLSP